MNISNALGRMTAGAVLFFGTSLILAPIVCVMLVSFSTSPVFDLPTSGVSLQWYARLVQRDALWPAVSLSLQLAALSTAFSLVLGTLCAMGLARARGRAREFVLSAVLSPMMLPGVVIGLSMLFAFRQAGLFNSYLSLVLAHIVITLPYIVRIVYSGLGMFDFYLVDAARILGCTPWKAARKVTIPVLAPSFLTAGMFAFITSLDNYALALFLGDVHTTTLPVQILKYIEYGTDPSIAALSSLMITFTIGVFFIGERLVGVQRLAGK